MIDISLIPSTCTDALWKLNQCAGTGGASYNLPVQLTCPSQPTYTCQGPTSTLYGPENYPSNCGNPNSWQAVPPVIPQAYFFPCFIRPKCVSAERRLPWRRYSDHHVPGGTLALIPALPAGGKAPAAEPVQPPEAGEALRPARSSSYR